MEMIIKMNEKKDDRHFGEGVLWNKLIEVMAILTSDYFRWAEHHQRFIKNLKRKIKRAIRVLEET